MKQYIATLLFLLLSANLLAQGEMDAIRLSGVDLRGTARGQAMGGAFGALGGDATGIMINPAGLGVYRTSELTATLALDPTQFRTGWQATDFIDRKTTVDFNFDNISYVGYYPTGNTTLPVINFAFSYNRLKNFHRQYSASGTDKEASLTDYIAATTNGIPSGDMNVRESGGQISYDPFNNSSIPWLSTLGWLGYLINDVPNSSENLYTGLFPNEKVSPKLQVSERGHADNYDFSLGTNFNDKLYFGLTVSMTDLYYTMSSSYQETFSPSARIGLDNSFQTEGTGAQLRLGAIWLPTDFLRVGLAYHSPAWYNLRDYYQAHTTANYPDVEPDTWARTPDGAWTSYRFNTPFSWVLSVAGVFGNRAIVSLDYEWKNYATMRLMDDRWADKADNVYIREDFTAASTLRAGVEYRLTPQLSLRGGYAYAQSPYEKNFAAGYKEAKIVGTVPHFTIDGPVHHLTAGIGYRFTPSFYLDLAFVHRTQQDELYPFPSVINADGSFAVESTPATLTNTSYKSLLTVGYKF
jgi:opacity protein-like surface antigen